MVCELTLFDSVDELCCVCDVFRLPKPLEFDWLSGDTSMVFT